MIEADASHGSGTPGTEVPDRRSRAAQVAVIVTAILIAIVAVRLAREVLVPLALSLVFATVLRPVVGRLERWRVPTPAAAALVVLVVLALFVGVGMAFEAPTRSMAAELPKTVATARAKLEELGARLRKLIGENSTQPLPRGGAAPARSSPASSTPAASTPAMPSSSASPGTTQTAGASSNQPPSNSPQTQSQGSSLGGLQSALRSAFGMTTALIAEVVEEVLLVFFLLATGKKWMEKLGRITRSPKRERLWPSIASEMHDVVARYLLVTLLINIGQAIVIALAVWALGMPTPMLWGALTFVAEFVPYFGGMLMIALLTLAGLSASQGLVHALLAPGIYLVVTSLQNNLVSPVAYGRGLRLNPTMILIGVMFWWMVWGVAGAFLAVPILASLRVLGSRIPSLEPMAVLLEE